MGEHIFRGFNWFSSSSSSFQDLFCFARINLAHNCLDYDEQMAGLMRLTVSHLRYASGKYGSRSTFDVRETHKF
jgi:hypothetical protein